MRARLVRRLAQVGIAGAGVLVLAGCPEEAAEIIEVRATVLDFDVAPLGGASFPTGALGVDGFILLAFDTSLADAFDRSVPGAGAGYTDEVPPPAELAGWSFGDWGNASTDPRLPALVDNDAFAGAMILIDPAVFGGHNPFFNDFPYRDLDPNTTYTLAFVRYDLQINGELDLAAVAQGQPVTQPDQLILSAVGTPKGDPTFNIEPFADIFAQADANPFVLGQIVTNATGSVDVDVLIFSTTSTGVKVLYEGTSAFDPADESFDSSLVARNDDTPTTLPRYNYMVLFRGSAATAADVLNLPQAMRLQIGQDFLQDGTPVNNSYAPFPTAAFTDGQLVAFTGGVGRPAGITVEVFSLEALSGSARWQAWLLNRDESPATMIPATANYERVAILRVIDPITGEILSETDSVMETVTGVSSFAGQLSVDLGGDRGVQEVKHRLILTDATTSEPVGFFTDLFLTLEEGAGAAAPSAASAIWFRFTDQNGTPTDFADDVSADGTILFGHFDTAAPTASRTFTDAGFTQSSGFGGVRDDEVSVEIQNLPLPPVGFYYEGWLVGPSATLSLGAIVALPPDETSLFDADIDPSLPGVTPTGIKFSVTRATGLDADAIVSCVGDDCTAVLTSFILTLEPKLGVATTKNVADLEIGTLPTATIIRRLRQ